MLITIFVLVHTGFHSEASVDRDYYQLRFFYFLLFLVAHLGYLVEDWIITLDYFIYSGKYG